MDRGEYWLLDSVIDSAKPIHWLHPSNSDLTMALNRKHHELSYEQLISTLMKMFRDGYLGVYEEEFDEWSQIPTLPTESDISKALSGDMLFHYAVTTKGGEIWERLSHPNWQQYSIIGGFENVYIAGGNEVLVKRLFQLYPLTINENVKIIEDSVVWNVETPWRATYWKTLPRGYRVQFQTQTREKETEHVPGLSYYHEWCQLIQWYTPYVE